MVNNTQEQAQDRSSATPVRAQEDTTLPIPGARKTPGSIISRSGAPLSINVDNPEISRIVDAAAAAAQAASDTDQREAQRQRRDSAGRTPSPSSQLGKYSPGRRFGPGDSQSASSFIDLKKVAENDLKPAIVPKRATGTSYTPHVSTLRLIEAMLGQTFVDKYREKIPPMLIRKRVTLALSDRMISLWLFAISFLAMARDLSMLEVFAKHPIELFILAGVCVFFFALQQYSAPAKQTLFEENDSKNKQAIAYKELQMALLSKNEELVEVKSTMTAEESLRHQLTNLLKMNRELRDAVEKILAVNYGDVFAYPESAFAKDLAMLQGDNPDQVCGMSDYALSQTALTDYKISKPLAPKYTPDNSSAYPKLANLLQDLTELLVNKQVDALKAKQASKSLDGLPWAQLTAQQKIERTSKKTVGISSVREFKRKQAASARPLAYGMPVLAIAGLAGATALAVFLCVTMALYFFVRYQTGVLFDNKEQKYLNEAATKRARTAAWLGYRQAEIDFYNKHNQQQLATDELERRGKHQEITTANLEAIKTAIKNYKPGDENKHLNFLLWRALGTAGIGSVTYKWAGIIIKSLENDAALGEDFLETNGIAILAVVFTIATIMACIEYNASRKDTLKRHHDPYDGAQSTADFASGKYFLDLHGKKSLVELHKDAEFLRKQHTELKEKMNGNKAFEKEYEKRMMQYNYHQFDLSVAQQADMGIEKWYGSTYLVNKAAKKNAYVPSKLLTVYVFTIACLALFFSLTFNQVLLGAAILFFPMVYITRGEYLTKTQELAEVNYFKAVIPALYTDIDIMQQAEEAAVSAPQNESSSGGFDETQAPSPGTTPDTKSALGPAMDSAQCVTQSQSEPTLNSIMPLQGEPESRVIGYLGKAFGFAVNTTTGILSSMVGTAADYFERRDLDDVYIYGSSFGTPSRRADNRDDVPAYRSADHFVAATEANTAAQTETASPPRQSPIEKSQSQEGSPSLLTKVYNGISKAEPWHKDNKSYGGAEFLDDVKIDPKKVQTVDFNEKNEMFDIETGKCIKEPSAGAGPSSRL